MSGEDKAKAIRAELREHGMELPVDQPLMDALGVMETIVLCEETAGEWELVIGRELAPCIEFVCVETLAEFKRHKTMPVTARARWHRGGEAFEWEVFDDSSAAKTTEEVPEWIQRLLQ